MTSGLKRGTSLLLFGLVLAAPLAQASTAQDGCLATSAGRAKAVVRDTPALRSKAVGTLAPGSAVQVVAIWNPTVGDGQVGSTDDWVITPKGFVQATAVRLAGRDCAHIVRVRGTSSSGPFMLRQDIDRDGNDDTQYMVYKLKDVLVSSLTSGVTPRGGAGATSPMLALPPFEPAPVGMLLPAVQKVRSSAVRLGEGCAGARAFDARSEASQCALISDRAHVVCTGAICISKQTSLPGAIDRTRANLPILAPAGGGAEAGVDYLLQIPGVDGESPDPPPPPPPPPSN